MKAAKMRKPHCPNCKCAQCQMHNEFYCYTCISCGTVFGYF